MVAQCSVSITSAEEFKYGRILWNRNKTLELCEDTIQDALDKDNNNKNDLTGKLISELMTLLHLLPKSRKYYRVLKNMFNRGVLPLTGEIYIISDAYETVSNVYYGPATTEAEFVDLYLRLDSRNNIYI